MVKNFFYRREGREVVTGESQALSNWTKKSSLLCFLRFLVSIRPKDLFCLKRARPGLESRIKFNQYIQHESLLSREHWWDLIAFESTLFFSFREFNWVSMSKIGELVWCPGGRIFFCSRGNDIHSMSFLIYFGIAYIWSMYHAQFG